MHTPRPIALLLFAASTLPLPTLPGLRGQDPTPAMPTAAHVGIGCGLQRQDDGSLLGLGTEYKATFADGRVEFTPMLGKAAPRDLPMAITVTHIGRGEMAAVGAAQTVRSALCVEFVRPELRELLDVRPEGIKQSFVFTQLPPGRGDLVVRTAFTTELQPERASSDEGLRFLFAGVGGVEIGQVIGIDAIGRRAVGSMRCAGAQLDFVLPADFVEHAVLPLTVDPLIGPLVFVSGTVENDSQPDLAHIGSPFNQYFIVWRRTVSAGNNDILGQRYTDDLTNSAGGGLVSFEATAVSSDSPRVVDVTPSACWFVTWKQAGSVMGAKVTSAAGLGATVTVAGGGTLTEPDLAGGSFGGQPIAIPVWFNTATHTIEGCVVNMTTNPPTVGAPITLASDPSLTEEVFSPVVSRANPLSIFMLTYRMSDSVTSARTLHGRAFNTQLAPSCSSFPIAGGAGVAAADASLAGDGRTWVIAYQAVSSGSNLLQCNTARVSFGLSELGAPRTLTPSGQRLANPAVAWLQQSTVIACTRDNGTQHDVLLLSIDPFTCADCETTTVVDTAGNDAFVAVTSRFQHSPASSEGAVAWVPIGVTSSGNLDLQRFVANDGTQTNLGGACAQGLVQAPCARVGNSGFRFRVRHALPGQFSWVALSIAQVSLGCGPCTIVPDTSIGVVESTGVTSPLGDASFPLPLPPDAGLIGLPLIGQFLFLGNSCFGVVQLTEGVRFVLQ